MQLLKLETIFALYLGVALFAGFNTNRASAQVFANDNAAPYANWQTGTNGGFGFRPWIFFSAGNDGDDGYAGYYLNNAFDPVASTNGQAWGLYANSYPTAAAEAFRAFSNSLPVNATFKILWHNEGIGDTYYNVGGFNLRNGDNTNLLTASNFIFDNSLFSFYYIGGGSDNFVVYDGNGVNTVPVNFNAGNGGLDVEVTLVPGGFYNLLIKTADGSQVLWSTNAQPLVMAGTMDSVALYDFDANGNQVFNDMEIYYAPPQIINLQPASGSVYVPPGGQFSFAVVSAASTIASNQIQLTLNGVLETGSAWKIIGSGTSSNEVILNTPLQDNQTFNGSIIATDAQGNRATNNFTFNTWETEPDNIYIEAADYNYGGGLWLNNFTFPQPNQDYGQFDLLGEQGIDFFVDNTAGTNNAYRPSDLPGVEPTSDIDHDNFANNGFQPYDLSYNENGQWDDYTRVLSNNVTYAVYARMAGFGDTPSMSLERMATPQVSAINQPGAALGTFVCPQTGGTQNWTFVPLADFFSNPVQLRFGGTNTFRINDVGGNGSYNVSYLLFVATSNNAPLGPYVAYGFPFPTASGVDPQQPVSLTIANRQTSVSPTSIQLFLNSNNITSSVTLSNNAAGTVVSYQPLWPSILPGGTDTLAVIFSDGSISQTDSWQFTVQTLPVLPAAWAVPFTNAIFAPGFYEQIAKGDDAATNTDFPPSVARAVAQLAGTLTNSATGLPYANEALNGGINLETNTINYAVDSQFYPLFQPATAFPDIMVGATNNIAMAADMYVQLSPGVYTFNVYSDDGFQFSAGSTPATTNLILDAANYGRPATDTQFSFLVTTNGLYPMQLLFFKSQEGGGGVELYSLNLIAGTSTLLNDPASPAAIKTYFLTQPNLRVHRSGANALIIWDNPAYLLQSATSINGPYTAIPGAASPWYVPFNQARQQFFRLVLSP